MAVAFGAFGAHALKGILETNGRLDVFETAVKYQFYHAFAILLAGVLSEKLKGHWTRRATFCFFSGVVVFSGSLYALSLSNIGLFGAITPLGGVLLMIGWIYLFVGIVKGLKD